MSIRWSLLALLSVLALAVAEHLDYVCSTGEVVSYSDYCDGKYDCPHYDDENCPVTEYCPYQSHHKCSDDGHCIESARLCNGYPDCRNGEDENYYECYRNRITNQRLSRFLTKLVRA